MAETIGSLVDKISIVQLKIYHFKEEIKREDIDDHHGYLCKKNIDILNEQLDDLIEELDVLVGDIIKGKRKLKIFRQFKMYNDPKFKRDIVD
jgi:hypothetical protein